MIIVTDSQKLQYELSNVARLFFPSEEMQWVRIGESIDHTQAVVLPTEQECTGGHCLSVTLHLPDGRSLNCSDTLCSSDINAPIELGKLLYRLLSELTGRTIDWGVLTGIRPVKLARKLRTEGKSPRDIEAVFIEQYLTTQEKAALCRLTDEVQQDIVTSALPRGYSLYISIPFCPSRCSYCSFVSHSIEKTWKLIPEYLEKLCDELRKTAKIAEEKGLVLQSVYMGGGTPTVLTASQMELVLTVVRECFDLSHCTEFTVEAGRPDTITPDKLEVMRRLGVDRISVNCQTINDDILESIGRKHSAKDFFDAYNTVKQFGFTAINVDLIAGLPDDTLQSFQNSLEQVAALSPDNITVHALTVKRAARLIGNKQTILGTGAEAESPVSQMISYSQRRLAELGYVPYYLYRQKGTVDSLENVGFSRKGKECRYNIFIMDETHTILSVGAGGVTKLVMQGDSEQYGEENVRIERIFNLKYPYEYMERFDTMLDRKRSILNFPL
ncbi:MAG: coproporphyrinogen dehydrogenase HemZ [Angelakisella sp.]